jgi:O-antigen/teichoic acid export membrane protein
MELNKITGPQHPRFVSSTISLGTLSIISVVLGLAGTIIITRHFPTEVFGAYTLILVVVSFLIQISTFGLDLSISRFIAAGKDEATKEHFISTAIIMRAAAILLACLFAWFGKPYLKLLLGESHLPSILAYMPLLFVLESFRALLKSILQGCLFFPQIGITDLIASFINLILLFLLVYLIKGNITYLILAKAISSFLSCVYAFVSIPIKKKCSFQLDIFKELIRFGFPLQITDTVWFVSNRIDTFVVAALLGPVNIALYEVARKIPDNSRLFYQPFRSVYYPFIAKLYAQEDRTRVSRRVNDSMRFVAFVTLLGTAIAVLFNKEIIRVVFSEKYLPSAPVFVVLMINLSLALICNVMGTSLVAVGDSKKPMIINLFNAVASSLGSILFIPIFGILGAAIAIICGTAISYLLHLYFLNKKLPLTTIAYLKPVFLFFVWASLVILIKPVSAFMQAGLLIVFLLGTVFLSIVTKEDVLLLAEGSGIASWRPLRKFSMWVTILWKT